MYKSKNHSKYSLEVFKHENSSFTEVISKADALHESYKNNLLSNYKELFKAGKNYSKDLEIILKNIPYYSFFSSIQKNSVVFTFRYFKSTLLNNDAIYGATEGKEDTLILFFDGNLYEKPYYSKKTTVKSLIPVKLRRVAYYIQNYGDIAIEIFRAYYKMHPDSGALQTAIEEIITTITNNKFYKEKTLPPIDVSDFVGHSSLNSFLREKYKNGHLFNWNRVGIQYGYMALKTLPYLDDYSKRYLINICHNKKLAEYFQDYMDNLRIEGFPDNFFDFAKPSTIGIAIIREIIKKNNPRPLGIATNSVIEDYIALKRYVKEPINLRISSWNRILEEHNRLADYVEDYLFNSDTTIEVNVPETSEYTKLRKILPKEFTWIKTTKNLLKEGKSMHHCVATYAEKINEDKCAIYHIDYDCTPYTLEFTKNKNKYKLSQIRGKFNQSPTTEVINYIESLLAS